MDDCCKLLDNGWRIELFRNALGSYSAVARHANRRKVITDDFTPTAALHRLTEKATTGRIVNEEREE